MPGRVAMRKFGGVVLLWVATAWPAPSQNPEAPIKVDVDVVNVLCTVYDKRGTLVPDLSRDDFRILENGRPQEIRYFARDTDLPLTIALLVDVSGSVRPFIEAERYTAAQFFHDVIHSTDQALLVGFSSTMILWQDLTPSVEKLQIALSRLRAVPFRGLPQPDQPMPGTLLYDTIGATAREKLSDVPGRKVIVIISDGLDNGSITHLEDAITAVQTANTIVYGICYNSGFSGCSFLRQLAEPTGGHVFETGKKESLSKIFQTIEDELRSQYALGYVPADGKRDGGFRKLQVKLRRSGLRVQARKGYYARREDAKKESGSE